MYHVLKLNFPYLLLFRVSTPGKAAHFVQSKTPVKTPHPLFWTNNNQR